MFIQNLTGGETAAFLGLAHKIVQADGVLAPEEERLLSALAATANYGGEAADGTVVELASAFGTRRARVSALLELMGLGFADGEYHPTEKALVVEIARALDVTEDELVGMESWVIRQVTLMEEAADFWNGEDA
jgi:uncharacterized tellurite resistance protein B-like protein